MLRKRRSGWLPGPAIFGPFNLGKLFPGGKEIQVRLVSWNTCQSAQWVVLYLLSKGIRPRVVLAPFSMPTLLPTFCCPIVMLCIILYRLIVLKTGHVNLLNLFCPISNVFWLCHSCAFSYEFTMSFWISKGNVSWDLNRIALNPEKFKEICIFSLLTFSTKNKMSSFMSLISLIRPFKFGMYRTYIYYCLVYC